jgi:hypothetical protein
MAKKRVVTLIHICIHTVCTEDRYSLKDVFFSDFTLLKKGGNETITGSDYI